MSSQLYTNKLIAGIGRVGLTTKVSNAFPVVGETVALTARTKWAQKVMFDKQTAPGGAVIREEITNASQTTSTNLSINAEGDLKELIRAENYRNGEVLFFAERLQSLYAMTAQILPYHNVRVSSEVNRTDQSFDLLISGENGYDVSRERIVQVYILKENGSVDIPDDVVSVRTAADYTNDDSELVFSQYKIEGRGIYDVETRYYDVAEQKAIVRRINKLITVTPRLAAKPVEGQEPFMTIASKTTDSAKIDLYKTGANDCYMEFFMPDSSYYDIIFIDDIPEGYDAYTIVVKKPNDNGISRLLMKCTEVKDPYSSPSPQFSEEHPLVITHDHDSQFSLYGTSWNTINLSAIWHCVIDGRGYHNLRNGMRFDRNPNHDINWPTTHVQVVGGSKYFEMFEVEIVAPGFAGMMIKTDPNNSNPWYWYGNFEMDSLWLHHMNVHDTAGEGCYLGYYTPGKMDVTYVGDTISFKNLKGETVTYTKGVKYPMKAHAITNFRFYRNTFERTGYDGVQISNCHGEVCYNTLLECAIMRESSQTSGLSIQSFAGKCYNNLIYNCNGPSMQVGPLGDLEIFNNVVYSENEGAMGIQFLFSLDTPEQNPTGGDSGVINNDIRILFHNNVIATEGMTANGTNTVQMRNMHFADNIIMNNGTLFSNMTSDTIKAWETQAISNLITLFTDRDATCIGYKVANYSDGDFRLASDSPILSMGKGRYFTHDFRGYKNWFGGIYPIGAYLGIYKSDAIDEIFRITSFTINNGDKQTVDGLVSIAWEVFPDKEIAAYMISENSDFAGAEWMDYTSGSAVQYRLGEKGNVTLYFKLKGSDGGETEARHASIEWISRTALLGINATMTVNADGVFNEDTGIHFFRLVNQKNIIMNFKDTTGTVWGTLVDNVGKSVIVAQEGITAGSDSGIYPDIVLQKNAATSITKSTGTVEEPLSFTITLPAGNYRVGILCNSNKNYSGTMLEVAAAHFLFTVNGVSKSAVSLKENFDTLVYWDTVVGEDGILAITAGWDDGALESITGNRIYGAVNLIKIEEN